MEKQKVPDQEKYWKRYKIERINIEELNKKVNNEQVILAVFSAEWCGQCRMSKLLIKKIKGDFPNIIFVEIDIDDNKLWDENTLKISQVPTFIGFKEKKIIFNESGYQSEIILRELLNNL